MIVYKFGGASIKDADSIKNVCEIISGEKQNITVVVSAIGKTTNLLEAMVEDYYMGNRNMLNSKIQKLKNAHTHIVEILFTVNVSDVLNEIDDIINRLILIVSDKVSQSYDFYYDQIVSMGELLSSCILSYYLSSNNCENKLLDIRDCFVSDSNYKEANINWTKSQELTNNFFKKNTNSLVVTQGFIASDEHGDTTSLGREGSDYSASILAYFLNANKICIWKDVLGVLNADPDYFSSTTKLDIIPYQEAIELSYYGANVIHPKTIKPLQAKGIPLFVKSFLDPLSEGTIIKSADKPEPQLPNYIVKKGQVLVNIKPLGFSDICEKDMINIFSLVKKNKIKLNFTQNTALSFAFCVDTGNRNFIKLLNELKYSYDLSINRHLELITIRHYNYSSLLEINEKYDILIEQKNINTAIYLVQSNKLNQ